MSSQTIAEAFAPVEARYKAEVMADTWGHLAPRKNKTYRGFIVFAIGCFGDDCLNPTPLSCEFKGLDSSPWFYDAMTEFLESLDKDEFAGTVWRFDGAFRNYEFKGSVQQMAIMAAGKG